MTLIELLTTSPAPIPLGIGRVNRCLDIDDEPSAKFCARCEEVKPIDQFYYRRTRNTYTTECKSCHAKRTAENWRRRKNAKA